MRYWVHLAFSTIVFHQIHLRAYALQTILCSFCALVVCPADDCFVICLSGSGCGEATIECPPAPYYCDLQCSGSSDVCTNVDLVISADTPLRVLCDDWNSTQCQGALYTNYYNTGCRYPDFWCPQTGDCDPECKSQSPTDTPTIQPSTAPTATIPGYRTIFDGCPAVGNEGSICVDADTGRGAVRCCSITGTSCSTLDLGCHSDKMFSEATDICTSNNMRLCTSTELQSGVCCGTGCNFDTELVWTSDGCSSEYPWTPFTEGNCNCAESRLFETAAYPTVGQCGEHCVSNYVQCRSFAVWTSAHNTGYCAGYDTACTSPCQIPTSAPNTNNVFNIISEWSLFAANGNCNCGDRLATHSSGYETEEKCGPLCASNSACQSFGIWTNLELGTCILFDTLCTATCSNPTSEGWANDIYNMNADATNR